MTTAALLPTPGDLLLAAYWCRNYEQVWRGEVDRLYVLVNGPDDGAADVYRSHGAIVAQVPNRLGHGQAMRWLLERANADTVVFMEDDAYVRRPGEVARALAQAALGCIIGCPRGGMDENIATAAIGKWGRIVGPDGSSGHGLWPAFLFGPTDWFLATDRRFESWLWRAGETIPGLGYTVPHDMTTDTMSALAFQLRDRHPIALGTNHKEIFQKTLSGDPPWFHAGGLSNDPAHAREGMGDSNEGRDWAHRFWWWRRIGHDYSAHIARAGVDVDYWTPIVEPWITWDD